jgi:hypothetical protein
MPLSAVTWAWVRSRMLTLALPLTAPAGILIVAPEAVPSTPPWPLIVPLDGGLG